MNLDRLAERIAHEAADLRRASHQAQAWQDDQRAGFNERLGRLVESGSQLETGLKRAQEQVRQAEQLLAG